MDKYSQGAASNYALGTPSAQERTASRIESDIERVKEMTGLVQNTASRIVRHARSLGYFEAPSDAKAQGPAPVVTTLADALNDLQHAINHASGALNVFD